MKGAAEEPRAPVARTPSPKRSRGTDRFVRDPQQPDRKIIAQDASVEIVSTR